METMALSVRNLTSVFAAEITGVDLTDLDDATFAQIEDAFETYSILVFPEQHLDDDQQIAFSRRFGDLEKTQAYRQQLHGQARIGHLEPGSGRQAHGRRASSRAAVCNHHATSRPSPHDRRG